MDTFYRYVNITSVYYNDNIKISWCYTYTQEVTRFYIFLSINVEGKVNLNWW